MVVARATFIKGDPYIRDMKNTAYVIPARNVCVLYGLMHSRRGHVSELSSCAWHPKDTQTFITGSADSTIRYGFFAVTFTLSPFMTDRIWNVENKRKQKTVVVVKSKERGARTKVTTCGYSPDGRYIAGGALCCY
jgi:WD repeat-containing protein 70